MPDDPRILDADELSAIARRVAREPTYQSGADCSQAFADRGHLLGHLVALELAGERALSVVMDLALDLDAARKLAGDLQDRAAEAPDEYPPGYYCDRCPHAMHLHVDGRCAGGCPGCNP